MFLMSENPDEEATVEKEKGSLTSREPTVGMGEIEASLSEIGGRRK